MQRLASRVIQAFACLALLLTLTTNVLAADANGTWTWTTPGRNGGPDRTSTLKLKTEDGKLTGTISGGRQGSEDIKISDAKLTGDEVTFNVTREFNGRSMTQKYTGKVSGDAIKGKVSFKNRDGEDQSRDWEAKRKSDDKK